MSEALFARWSGSRITVGWRAPFHILRNGSPAALTVSDQTHAEGGLSHIPFWDFWGSHLFLSDNHLSSFSITYQLLNGNPGHTVYRSDVAPVARTYPTRPVMRRLV